MSNRQEEWETVATSKIWVSPDGSKMMFEFSDSSATSGDPVIGKGKQPEWRRARQDPMRISGSWRTSKMDTMSDNGLIFTYKVADDS